MHTEGDEACSIMRLTKHLIRCLHGSLEQRARWFITGSTSGKVESCDTFNAALWTGSDSTANVSCSLNVR